MKHWGAVALALVVSGCNRSFTAPRASSGPAPLAASASPTLVAPFGLVRVTASGGVPPYILDEVVTEQHSGPGAKVDPVGLTYRAGAVGGVTDVLRLRDSKGSAVTLSIAVGPALTIAPAAIALAPGQSWSFAISGGQPPYCVELTSDNAVCAVPGKVCGGSADAGASCVADGGACIDAQGTYRAGTCGHLDTLTVTDASGFATASAFVNLGPPLHLTLSQPSVTTGQPLFFQVSGGVPPYTFRWARHGNASDGVLGTGTYVAGPNPDVVDEIEAQDAVLSVASARVQVNGPQFSLPAAGRRYDLYSGDFNGDGAEDVLAVSDQAGGFFSAPILALFTGYRDGLTEARQLSLADHPDRILVADVNGDGTEDLVLAYDGPSPYVSPQQKGAALQLALGRRDGTFDILSPLGVAGAPGGSAILQVGGGQGQRRLVAVPHAIADDGGAVLDLFGADPGGVLSLLRTVATPPLGDAFEAVSIRAPREPAQTYLLSASATAPQLCAPPALDILGVAAAAQDDGGFELSFGALGCGTTSGLSRTGAATGGSCDQPVLFDGADGPVSFLCTNFENSTTNLLSLLRALADGGFQEQNLGLELDGMASTNLMGNGYRVGDLQGEIDVPQVDGTLRLVAAPDGGARPRELSLGADGGVSPYDAALGARITSLVGVDVNGDTLQDMVTVDLAGSVRYLRAGLAGRLAVGHANLLHDKAVARLSAADLDGDGNTDVVIAEREVRLFWGRRDGHLAAGPELFRSDFPIQGTVAGQGSAWIQAQLGDGGSQVVRVVPLDDQRVSISAVQVPADGQYLTQLSALSGPGDGVLVGAYGQGRGGWVGAVRPLPDAGLAVINVGADLATFNDFHVMVPAQVSSASGPEDLVLFTSDGSTFSGLEVRPALPGGSWGAQPSSTLDLSATLGKDGLVTGLFSFASTHEGPRDRLLAVGMAASGGACGSGDPTLFLLAATGGQLTILDSQTFVQMGPCDAWLWSVSAVTPAGGGTELVLSDGNNIEVFSNASASLGAWRPLDFGGIVRDSAAGDFDGDGLPDLAYSRVDRPELQTLYLHPDGGLY